MDPGVHVPCRHGVGLRQYLERHFATDGRHVTVTPVSWNANSRANGGNSVSFGFVGNQTGANPPPASFTFERHGLRLDLLPVIARRRGRETGRGAW
jgi:hypothetical protein